MRPAGGASDMAATAATGSAGEVSLPILLDGSTGTQAYVCAAPVPPCTYRSIVAGKSDLMIDNVVGTILGGNLTLEWSAASAATEELAFGVMLMGGEGEACASVSLGLLKGASPLQIGVDPAERPLCPGEVLHVWASNGIYLGEEPAYVQLDVDQPFHLEGALRLASAPQAAQPDA